MLAQNPLALPRAFVRRERRHRWGVARPVLAGEAATHPAAGFVLEAGDQLVLVGEGR